VLWVGSQGGLETDLVKRAGIPYTAIPAGGVHLSGRDLLRLPGNLLRLAQGYLAARRILREFKPDLLLYTGGYVAVPMGVAGRRIPSLLFVPDIEPGMALKALERFASCVAVTTEASREYLRPGTHMEVSGYPLRPELTHMDVSRARGILGIEEDLPVLLVLGGSKGTLSINRAVFAGLSRLLEHCQVVQITGQSGWPEVEGIRAQLSEAQNRRYRAFAYLHDEIGAAFSVANLVISRSGASTLGEYPAFGLPAILVPYPYAWRYQKINAAFLENKGAAVTLADADLGANLVDTALSLVADPARLAAMRTAMQSLATPQAAEKLAGLARELAAPASGAGGKAGRV
jgi:UDP-N-acetylglucosamine--N-acetylmuramyl-(pentapeptide) pyrophosphoryl-undecaprenol N-acetylglucosamine transferase